MAKRTLRSRKHLAMQRVLRAMRIERGYKQRELSKKLGRSENYVTLIETGQRRLDIPEFFELTEAIGADPVAVFTRIAHWSP